MIKKFKEKSLIKKILTILFALVILLILTLSGYWINRVGKNYYDKSLFESLDVSAVNKLMIVAHPDDETLWGGGHLSEGGYLVLCITDGYNETRKNEFDNAVKCLNETNIPVILNFPDKTFNKRDNWYGIKGKISNAVDKVIEMKDWDLIVTHNKEGEYGHIHHKMTSSIVRKEYNNTDKKSPLYLFGTYHSLKNLPTYESGMIPMNEEEYNKKVEALGYYKSQKKVVEGLFHMVKYENWIEYDGND